jgi:hypothetical protein
MDLGAELLIHDELHAEDRGKQGEHDGRCRCRRWAFVSWNMPVMIAEIEADLPLDHRIDEQSHDGEHR